MVASVFASPAGTPLSLSAPANSEALPCARASAASSSSVATLIEKPRPAGCTPAIDTAASAIAVSLDGISHTSVGSTTASNPVPLPVTASEEIWWSVHTLRRLVVLADQGRRDQPSVLEHISRVDPVPAHVLPVVLALRRAGRRLHHRRSPDPSGFRPEPLGVAHRPRLVLRHRAQR